MKFKFLLLAFFFSKFPATAQFQLPACKSVEAIALSERNAHARLGETGTNGIAGTMSSDNFDIKYYRCEWEIDPSVRYIRGKITAYFVITKTSNSITLDLLSPLLADSIWHYNEWLALSQGSNTVTAGFFDTLSAGTLDSVTIYYHGIPSDTGFGSFIQSAHNGTPVIWSLSEPYGSRDWWPCKNGLDDKADSIDVYITTPTTYKAASNGVLIGETVTGNRRIAHWQHRYPIASYLICLAVTNYSVFNNSVQIGDELLPMQTYCYPEYLNSFQSGTNNTLAALQFYSNIFGNYPFLREKYGHVQFGWGGGMEHQTCTFVVSIDESLCSHELAHQWFGDKITCATWKDIWLNEGFATFLSSMYMENKYPSSIIATRKSEIATITAYPGGSVMVDDTTSVDRIFDSRLSYLKGSHLLYMLRWILGDSAFFAGLNNYLQDPALAYGFARTQDLRKHLEQSSGKDLGYFFKEWYEGQGYPSFTIEWANAEIGNVHIRVSQAASHSSVSFFELPVALRFSNATQQKTVVVNNITNGEIFFKAIGFVADTAIIDPEYWLITARNKVIKRTDIPVPIAFQQFTVRKQNCAAQIAFSCADESNIKDYSLECSINGSKYIGIATIEKNRIQNTRGGFSGYEYNYPFNSSGLHLFRIRMNFIDGSVQYSYTIATEGCSPALEIVSFYDPLSHCITVKNLMEGKKTIRVINVSGQPLITVQTFDNDVTFHTENIPKGNYVIQISHANGTSLRKSITLF